VLKALRDLPPLSTVVTAVLKESESSNSAANRMQELIQSDQALTGKVLRVVNSPYYGLTGQVTSLLQACVILGNQQIRNLVMSMGVMSAIQPKGDAAEKFRHAWQHALGASLAVQSLAKRRNISVKDQEVLFVASLLHDIGRVFLLCNFEEIYAEVLRQSESQGKPIAEAEMNVIGLSHAEVGAAMAESWKLPAQIKEIIGHHEGPFIATSSPLTMLVHASDELTKHYYEGGTPAEIAPEALAWLNPKEGEFESLASEVNEKLAETSSSFGLAA
jgi:putative nucleotidyltransferase with HDIG domain